MWMQQISQSPQRKEGRWRFFSKERARSRTEQDHDPKLPCTGSANYNGITIKLDENQMNLPDMSKADGGPAHREPLQWRRKEGANFIRELTDKLNLTVEQGINGNDGRYGGTFEHYQVATAYAKYISPEFRNW